MAIVLPPALQLTLDLLPHNQLSTDMLVQLTGIVAVALVGGLRPAVLAAVLAGLFVNYFSVRPFRSLLVIDAEHVLALVVFLLVAVAVYPGGGPLGPTKQGGTPGGGRGQDPGRPEPPGSD